MPATRNSIAEPRKSARGIRTLRWRLVALAAAFLAACGVNPVTGEKELQLVSESQEINIGREQYLPSRQMQGGDYTVDPSVGDYVRSVGERLAATSDRALPYEFTVLNNSVPNAWALPGGKIAINRGLLTELGSEAELAAVLGHEIVHSAARHGAKSVERGLLLQGALIALAVSVTDNRYANLIVGGAQVGAQLITLKHGRDAEREADRYGMQYMARAGYNPSAAVDLQETFVRLSEGKSGGGWLNGLLASHPPSRERVEANRATAAELGDAGDYATQRYRAAVARLVETKPAYDSYDEAIAALQADEPAKARKLANAAIAIEPREARFHALLGDIDASRRRYSQAIANYDRAAELDAEYFQIYLGRGLARERAGELRAAELDLQRSIELLPTATAYNALGEISARAGRRDQAIEYFRTAASSQSDVGREAAVSLAKLELPRNPGAYIETAPRLDADGQLIVLLANRAPLAVTFIGVDVRVVDPTGTELVAQRSLTARQVLQPGAQTALATGLGPFADAAQLRQVRISVSSARVVD